MEKSEIIKNMIESSPYKKEYQHIWQLLQTIVCLKEDGKINKIASPPKRRIYRDYNSITFHQFLCELINVLNPVQYTYDLSLLNESTYNFSGEISIEKLNRKGVVCFHKTISNQEAMSIMETANNQHFVNFEKNKVNKNFDIFESGHQGIWWNQNQSILWTNTTVQKLVTNESLLFLVHNYFKTTPILHSINFWASYPGQRETTQIYHQDWDDLKLLKVFIYLNDVTSENGPHYYMKNSLREIIECKKTPKGHQGGKRVDDNFFKNYKDKEWEICGKAGTMVVEDTNGFHRGSSVKEGQRYILQFLFGVSRAYDRIEYASDKSFTPKISVDKEKSPILYQAQQKYPFIYQHFQFN
tara:strand:+ start:21811 stop:22875 length:1065 start_codon:yes stop_codon:yes gene_type:complete